MRQIDADALKIAIEDNFIGNSYDINKVIDEQDTLAVPDSDTISRKAAIEAVEFGITYAKAINKETGEVTALFEESNAELREAADRIKKLPSALPEHIIHCKDCKYFKQVFAPNDNDGLCGHWHSKCDARTNRNGYCSHAERKQNDTERC